MNKSIFSILFSTRLMAFLFIAFAGAMAAGTFIEDATNTDVAKKIIYNAWWFEVIMVFFVINFFGNIKRYQLYKKEKWATLLLHLSFIFILIGAFVTRYISYEGMMPIREGETSSVFYSDKTYLTALVDGEYQGEMKRKTFSKDVLLTPVNLLLANNNFSIRNEFNGIPFEIEYKDFVMNATESFEANENGNYYIKLVESGEGTRHDHYLKEGEVQNIHNILFAFNKFTKGAINITKTENEYFIQAPFEGNFMRMADKFQGGVVKDSVQPLMLRSLYNLGGSQFVLPEPAIKGNLVSKSNGDFKDKSSDDAVTVLIKAQGKQEELTLIGSKGKQGVPQNIKVGDLDFTLFYGSKVYELPFSIKLDDFIADKYPGTEKSYSAYKSKLEIADKRENKVFKDSVFMNNILDYDGHRFFQAGFDPDEKGTNLSVNHDFWGTWITYFGYFLLYFGLMAILFDKNTRFADLKRKLENVKLKKSTLMALGFLLFSMLGFSQHNHSENEVSPVMPDTKKALEFIKKQNVSQEQADAFGKIVIQDAGGRMKPINTFSSELLRKVSKSDTFEGMDSDQVLLSMTQFPEYWYQIPIIYLKRGNDSIRKIAGIDKDVKFAKLIDFFDAKGNYKLEPLLEKAYAEAIPNQFQKDFIETDKKINLLYSAIGGQILKVFPIPNDPNNKWVSYLEVNQPTGTALDTIKNVLPFYLNAVNKATQSNDYTFPNSLLTGLTKYQKLYGSKVMLSEKKIESEILYNKYDIFKKLHYWYMFAGIMMLFFSIIGMFNAKKWISHTINGFHILIGLFFVLHTVGLIVRWYISGHAPWSDAYESMIYVAWATMFFGLAFDRKSKLTIASTAFVVSMILMVAHWNWMDPTIGNLQPVLNSYWLMIHVAVIVASYGPFTLAMMLGLVSLFLMIFTTEKNKAKMKLSIQELTYINELALTVGLVMLTIGNFLGGQWANESWGRYWGWDPKETWALISIMIYAFVIHARFVPALRGLWVYNFMSVLAFASILMTYFGVNFHLSGMHSYASGEKQSVVYYVYILAGVLVIAFFALSKYRKFYKK
ncbi:cytochrome c biogenesis protein CcsA [Flavobacterium sp.]|uniref:cytochrome c biogenesis protein n=1 Tax=Flavobacterium sp. TaxID=239 RepID=UPI003F6951BF